MTTGMRATGSWSFRPETAENLGMGMMVAVLKHLGTFAWESDVLQVSVITSETQSLRTLRSY